MVCRELAGNPPIDRIWHGVITGSEEEVEMWFGHVMYTSIRMDVPCVLTRFRILHECSGLPFFSQITFVNLTATT